MAGAKNLQPLYEKIAKAIRSVDNNTLIFYEPVTWGGTSNLR
jgi:endoglycosylceramidase